MKHLKDLVVKTLKNEDMTAEELTEMAIVAVVVGVSIRIIFEVIKFVI